MEARGSVLLHKVIDGTRLLILADDFIHGKRFHMDWVVFVLLYEKLWNYFVDYFVQVVALIQCIVNVFSVWSIKVFIQV